MPASFRRGTPWMHSLRYSKDRKQIARISHRSELTPRVSSSLSQKSDLRSGWAVVLHKKAARWSIAPEQHGEKGLLSLDKPKDPTSHGVQLEIENTCRRASSCRHARPWNRADA